MELLLLLLLLKMGGGGLKPGMTGLVTVGGKNIGMAAIMHAGKLGWTNVLPAENMTMRTAFPLPGARIVIKSGSKTFHAVRDGDGPQGGPFFRA